MAILFSILLSLVMKFTTTSAERNAPRHPPPLLGFGTYNSFEDNDKMAEAVKEAIKCGYRHFDLAKLYNNEAEIGMAMRECIDEGIVSREELYVCTKLWMTDAAPEDVEDALKGSLERMGFEYIDNFMMHWPQQWTKDSYRIPNSEGGGFNFKVIHTCDPKSLLQTWNAMESLVDKGLARSISVSNFDEKLLSFLMTHCRIKPSCHEVEMHPYLAQKSMVKFCHDNDIALVAYSSLGKLGYKEPEDPVLLDDPVVVEISQRINRTPAQVLLRWVVQQGVAVIPKSLSAPRIRANAAILDWVLSDSDMEKLNQLDRGHRFVRVPWFDFAIYDDNITGTSKL